VAAGTRDPMAEQDDGAGAPAPMMAPQPNGMAPQQPPMPYNPLTGGMSVHAAHFTTGPMVLPNPSAMTSGPGRMYHAPQDGGARPRLGGPMMNPMPGGYQMMSQQQHPMPMGSPAPMAATPPSPGGNPRAVYAYPVIPTSAQPAAGRSAAPARAAPGPQARYNPLAAAAAAVAAAEGVVQHVGDPPGEREQLSPKAQRKISHNAVEVRQKNHRHRPAALD